MSDGDGSRASRLAERRSQSADESEQSQPSQRSQPSESPEASQQPVKEAYDGMYIYIPPEQKARISPLYKQMSAAFEVEFGDELEKNRHFYPLLVEHGLAGLEEFRDDPEQIRESLESLSHSP